MTTYTYRAVWPITDPDRTRSALIAEASAGLDAMARTDGARLTGQPAWTVAGDRLLCEAPAVPLPDEAVDTTDLADRNVVVLRLAGLRWSDRQIAATTGVPRSTVRDILARDRQPAAA
ncbi:hypothetical protein ACH4T9_31325 [Micromonospora sp. NPDC020750]|uniref:hypothetical protein n=1 Tax=unclassified Micromonospora TaxID=2617518 RepID=UPI00379E2B17